MKRTGEIVLGVIGALVYGLFAGIGALMVWMQGNEEVIREVFEEDPTLAGTDIDKLIDTMGTGGWTLIIISAIAIVLGIIAMVLIKGNKKPKTAGIIFIVTAVVVTVVQFGIGLFGGIFYLIAGIMCLARKPKEMIE